jgi:transposase
MIDNVVSSVIMRKERLELTETERQKLQELVRKGENQARAITRARLLILSDQGWEDQKIADALQIGRATVERVRRRAVREGVETALVDRPRPGQQRKLDAKQEAQLVAIACSDPPPGQKRWTVRLLMEEIIQQELVETISFETVRRVLKKTMSNHGG